MDKKQKAVKNAANASDSASSTQHHSGKHRSLAHHNSLSIKHASNRSKAVEHFQNVNKLTVSIRNKNEEAILDLRTRIPDTEKFFDVHSRIGNGTFSTVLLGTLKKEHGLPDHMRRKFAIKHHIPTSHPDRIMKELQCMAKIGGTANVVGINCCFRLNESVAFVMPYLAHDRFHDFFSKMDIPELQNYMKNLLIALRHVHRFNVIHRDVKPSNFLYNRRRRQFLLVDFGLAQMVPASESPLEPEANHPYMSLQSSQSHERKRARDLDDDGADLPATSAGGVNPGKRIRHSGPQGDQQTPATSMLGENSRAMNNNGFKMPLKQLNEISTPVKMGVVCNNDTYDGTTVRQVNGMSRVNQKPQTGNTTATAMATASTPPTYNTVDPGKYNTNRNLNATNAAKCLCYGNPNVCNVCLVRKEIHASRAGTPGYRPPEVLLKYPDQTTAVDMWAAGVIFLSILSSVYPFFKAPNDYVALAEMVTIFGDKSIRKTAYLLDRLVTLSQKTKSLDLRKLCVRFRNRIKFSSPSLLKKHEKSDGTCEVCKNCDQYFFNCLCSESPYKTEPLDSDDPFPPSTYDLLYRLLEVNPHIRITADEALKHPFFSESFGRKANSEL